MNRKNLFIIKHSCGDKSRGFTLIEIMIALTIFAVVSAALVRNASMSVRQTAIVTERTLACGWVKINSMKCVRCPAIQKITLL